MKYTGGPAFPYEQGHTPDGKWNQSFDSGMTLRDYFAAAALQGFCANSQQKDWTIPEMAADAFLAADAMLAERDK